MEVLDPPTFTRLPAATQIEKGALVVLEIEFIGSGPVAVTWMVGPDELSLSTRPLTYAISLDFALTLCL